MYEKTEKDITPTETLTFLENQLAYGFTSNKVNSTTYEIVLAGYKKINFRLRIIEENEESEGQEGEGQEGEGQKGEGGVRTRRELTIHLDGDYFGIFGIFVHQSMGFFTSGIDGISIIYADKEDTLQAKYLANHET
jgi:hypothetical protein